MGKKSEGRSGSDYRKLQNMKNDLIIMKKQLMPDEKDVVQDAEMKGFDDFQRKKHELNTLMNEIRVDVDRLNEMRKRLGDGNRDNVSIKLNMDNSDRIRRCGELFVSLRAALDSDEKAKRKKKSFSERDLADRRDMVVLIGHEILNLGNDNAKHRAESDEVVAMRSRVDRRKHDRAAQTKQRRDAAKHAKVRRGSGKNSRVDDVQPVDDDDEFKDVGPQTDGERAFEAQVQVNYDEQDKVLILISNGLSELMELAKVANTQLVIQAEKLRAVEDNMDKTIVQFKSANNKMKNMLEESGGMTRWCPIIICIIFLLALVGYMFGIV